MIEKTKKRKKGRISEEDAYTLLQRYPATVVLALLHEVAEIVEEVYIDWDELVKKTSTGISNAREYQMLWRHLAYRHSLLDKKDDVSLPKDDDSDFDYDVEAFPNISSEASSEAAACVKVLMASGSDPNHPNGTVEAPLTINIPNGQSVRANPENSRPAAMQGMNITIPVSVQRQPSSAVTVSEAPDSNGPGTGNMPRKRRKPWSEAEDMELIAAVQKYGEGNWANIVRGEFKGDRTASQLSQRWGIIRKRGNLNLSPNQGATQLSEAQKAARHAMNVALNLPPRNIITNNSVGPTLSTISTNNIHPTATTETSPAQHQSQQRPVVKTSSLGPIYSLAKPQVNLKSTSAIPDFSSDPVRAAAVAAGARIATPSDAASLLKAAQAKNAVYIMPSGGSSIKASMTSSAATRVDSPSNGHFISTAMSSVPLSAPPVSTSSGPCIGLVKASNLATKVTPDASVSSSEQNQTDFKSNQDGKIRGGAELSENSAMKQVIEDGSCVSINELSKQVKEDGAAFPNQEAADNKSVPENDIASPKVEMVKGDPVEVLGNKADEGRGDMKASKITSSPVKKLGDQPAVQPAIQQNGENRNAREQTSTSKIITQFDEHGMIVPEPAQHCKE